MSDKKQNVELVLRNTSVKYAKVLRPGKAYDESKAPEYSVNLYVSEADRDTLMAHGVNPKEDKDGNEYFLAKRSTRNSKGDEVKPPVLVGPNKAPFTEDIGNGSVCNVAITLFPWERQKRRGVLLYLNAMQVVTHVAYRASAEDHFNVIEGTDDVVDKF